MSFIQSLQVLFPIHLKQNLVQLWRLIRNRRADLRFMTRNPSQLRYVISASHK
jgi:hypothetical protein